MDSPGVALVSSWRDLDATKRASEKPNPKTRMLGLTPVIFRVEPHKTKYMNKQKTITQKKRTKDRASETMRGRGRRQRRRRRRRRRRTRAMIIWIRTPQLLWSLLLSWCLLSWLWVQALPPQTIAIRTIIMIYNNREDHNHHRNKTNELNIGNPWQYEFWRWWSWSS